MYEEKPQEGAPSYGASQGRPASEGESRNLDEGLRILKEEFQRSQAQIDNLTKQRDALKEDMAALERVVSEVKQASNAYGQASPMLEREKNEFRVYLDNKIRMIEAAIGDRKAQIDRKIEELTRDLQAKWEIVQRLQTDKSEADKEYEAAKKAVEGIQDSFDQGKTYGANLEKKFKEMKDLRIQIEKEDDQNHPASMYFLARELKGISDGTDLLSKEQLENKLSQIWYQLNEARGKLREKKTASEAAKTALEAEQKALDGLKQKHREKILEGISGLN